MRILTDHMVNPANDRLIITVTDEPGAGGANHAYLVAGFNPGANPSVDGLRDIGAMTPGQGILFQNGPINEVGVNGITHEALLAIVADRLRCFQAGPYACEENALALEAVLAALGALHHRTRKRMERGVEGTNAQ